MRRAARSVHGATTFWRLHLAPKESSSVHGGQATAPPIAGAAAAAGGSRHTVHGGQNFADAKPEATASSSSLWPLNVFTGPSSPFNVRRRRTSRDRAGLALGGSPAGSRGQSVHGATNFAQVLTAGTSSEQVLTPTRGRSYHGEGLFMDSLAEQDESSFSKGRLTLSVPVPVAEAPAAAPALPASMTKKRDPLFVIDTNPPFHVYYAEPLEDDMSRIPQYARILHEICARNDSTPVPESPVHERSPSRSPSSSRFRAFRSSKGGEASRSIFDAHPVPKMALSAFLERIAAYTKFGPACFAVAFQYLRRVLPDLHGLTFANCHRLLIASIHLASKATEDTHHPNSFMALVAGIRMVELNKLENELCRRLEWRLMPDLEEIESWRRALRDDPLGYGSFWSPASRAFVA